MKKINHILLIDDDEIANHINKLLIEDLHLAPYIAVAFNGQEAMEIIKEKSVKDQQPLLILLDLNMPVMDGFEFLAALEDKRDLRREHIYIVILTSSSNDKDVEIAKHYNIHGYLEKPLTEEKITGLITQIEENFLL